MLRMLRRSFGALLSFRKGRRNSNSTSADENVAGNCGAGPAGHFLHTALLLELCICAWAIAEMVVARHAFEVIDLFKKTFLVGP